MKIGVVSDIHGNLAALDAVLSNLDTVDKIICCGDIVGYGPQPKECVEAIRDVAEVVVQGNHDKYVSNPTHYNNPVVSDGLRHAQNELAHPQIRWLQSLQITQEVDNYMITHSHPVELEKRINPEELSRPPSFTYGYDGLLFGHTHKQHDVIKDGVHIVNPGSVGQPRDGDNRAAYAIVDTEQKTANLKRQEYDIEKTVKAIEEAGLSDEVSERIRNAN